MGDSEAAHGARAAGSSLLGAVIAGGGMCAMAVAATSIGGDARGAGGQEQLILWVLLALAAAGALLCFYLATVWALAAVIQLAGPAGRLGRMLLPALRILAPRVARRVSLGAAVASAATGLVLGPALASEPMPGGAEDRPTVLQTSQLLPDEEPEPSPSAEPGAPLPSLGWGGDPSPATEPAEDEAGSDEPTEDEPTEDETADDETTKGEGEGAQPAEDKAASEQPTEDEAADDETTEDETTPEEEPGPTAEETESEKQPADAQDAEDAPTSEDGQDAGETESPGDGTGSEDGTGDGSAPAARSVVVRPGDTLWSITDDVLGPAPDDPALLAASWPLLHEANLDVIGEDPDMLRPGQVLTVPAGLDEEAAS